MATNITMPPIRLPSRSTTTYLGDTRCHSPGTGSSRAVVVVTSSSVTLLTLPSSGWGAVWSIAVLVVLRRHRAQVLGDESRGEQDDAPRRASRARASRLSADGDPARTSEFHEEARTDAGQQRAAEGRRLREHHDAGRVERVDVAAHGRPGRASHRHGEGDHERGDEDQGDRQGVLGAQLGLARGSRG